MEGCQECYYTKNGVNPRGEETLYNIGCENPLPTCDISNVCRACESDAECVSKNITSTIYLDVGDLSTIYEYSIISTNLTSVFDDSEGECKIYEAGDEIAFNMTSASVCEQIVRSYALCNETCSLR